MQKGYWGLAALILVMGLSGCATIPEKKGADDCLVVIKIQKSNPGNLDWARQYRFEFTPTYPSVGVPTNSGDLTFVVKEPGVKITRVTSRIGGDGNYVGGTTDEPADVSLPYDPGHLVVLDLLLIRRLEKTPNGVMEYFYFEKFKEEDRVAAQEALQKDPKYATWVQN